MAKHRKLFKKHILSVGDYEANEGTVVVTPARLKHWENTFREMSLAKQVIPVRLDHGKRTKPMGEKEYLTSLGAGKTVGRLAGFKRLGRNKAEITLELRNKGAIDIADDNIVGVSPVLVNEFTDSHGTVHKDAITFVDMVNYPVDHSQSEFVEAGSVAMGLRIGKAIYMAADKSDEDDDDEDTDDDGIPDVDDDDDDNDGLDDDDDPTPQGDLKGVIDALKAKNIVMAPDTNYDNFIDRLHTALLTSNAHDADNDDDDDPNTDSGVGAEPSSGNMPTMMANDPWRVLAEKQHRETIAADLEQLVKDGRATPAEVKAYRQQTKTIRLSLGKDKQLRKSSVEQFIEHRSAVPKGTFWSDQQRLSLSLGNPAEPPDDMREFSPEDADKAADFVLRRDKR